MLFFLPLDCYEYGLFYKALTVFEDGTSDLYTVKTESIKRQQLQVIYDKHYNEKPFKNYVMWPGGRGWAVCSSECNINVTRG